MRRDGAAERFKVCLGNVCRRADGAPEIFALLVLLFSELFVIVDDKAGEQGVFVARSAVRLKKFKSFGVFFQNVCRPFCYIDLDLVRLDRVLLFKIIP